jgi:hypothetical protein
VPHRLLCHTAAAASSGFLLVELVGCLLVGWPVEEMDSIRQSRPSGSGGRNRVIRSSSSTRIRDLWVRDTRTGPWVSPSNPSARTSSVPIPIPIPIADFMVRPAVFSHPHALASGVTPKGRGAIVRAQPSPAQPIRYCTVLFCSKQTVGLDQPA